MGLLSNGINERTELFEIRIKQRRYRARRSYFSAGKRREERGKEEDGVYFATMRTEWTVMQPRNGGYFLLNEAFLVTRIPAVTQRRTSAICSNCSLHVRLLRKTNPKAARLRDFYVE